MTKFQEEYLHSLLMKKINELALLGAFGGDGEDRITNVVFAVTSANQENSRYNPVPFFQRVLGIDRFMQKMRPWE